MSRQLQIQPSSNIAASHYDAEKQTLEVHFKNGGKYAYDDVSPSSASAFENAPSSGKHFAGSIVGKYPTRKL